MRIERCPGVYDPEDDSYLLMGIEEINGRLLEIGCGTGIVGLSYAESGTKVTLIDISRNAVRCARENAATNGISVDIIRTSLFDGVRGKFDYCIFNPPYLPSGQPDHPMWTGGSSGNELTVKFLRAFPKFSRHAFYIESSLSPIQKEMYEGLSFRIIRKIDYEFEVLTLVKVTSDALDR
jgi:release factor glutamine methyltransferase